MASRSIVWLILLSLLTVSCLPTICNASEGDRAEGFIACVSNCTSDACSDDSLCSSATSPGAPRCTNASAGNSDPLAFFLGGWKEWDCFTECRYQCMKEIEAQRASEGLPPVKYFGKWPFDRHWGMQEPASVGLSLLNLLATLYGLVTFMRVVYWQLPRRAPAVAGKGAMGPPYYEYGALWVVYAVVATHAWFRSAVFHIRDTPSTEALDYSSAIALLGTALIVAVIRTASLRLEAARVMVAAPLIAFTATHILFLNFYQFDYGFNMKVCLVMGAAQLLLWLLWAIFSPNHPKRLKVIFTVLATVLALGFEVYDFPPMWGVFDAHALWHATTVPITMSWWSFVVEDARWRTKVLMTHGAGQEKTKKVEKAKQKKAE
eukprot:TRINITY_DN15017_c0_g1_i1.p1 TRINITY_DN15017_c0_g1~~TRINITY_DN15017_c0_g1_i1.p1  ORF type:complete len:376 (+),score=50.83 TRINITY_DN15017_c0_g1_i1:252-1379(+)